MVLRNSTSGWYKYNKPFSFFANFKPVDEKAPVRLHLEIREAIVKLLKQGKSKSGVHSVYQERYVIILI